MFIYILSGIQAIDAKFLSLVSHAYAAGTVSNYKSQWRAYINFCLKFHLQLFPPVQDNIIRFYTHLVFTLKAYSSLQNYQSAINIFYRFYGYTLDNTAISTRVLNMAAKKQLSTVPATKAPLEIHQLQKFLQVCDYSCPFQMTFMAALQVGFMALLRRSNICPPSVSAFDPAKHLLRSDILVADHGLTVKLRWTKTNQTGDTVYSIPIASSANPAFDPPAFYKQFVHRFPVHDKDPCFSFYCNGRHYVLIHRDLSTMLSVFLQKCGFSPDGVTTHSIRKGGATLLMRSGADISSIQAQGTWSSDCYKRYLVHNDSDKLKATQQVYKYLKLC